MTKRIKIILGIATLLMASVVLSFFIVMPDCHLAKTCNFYRLNEDRLRQQYSYYKLEGIDIYGEFATVEREINSCKNGLARACEESGFHAVAPFLLSLIWIISGVLYITSTIMSPLSKFKKGMLIILIFIIYITALLSAYLAFYPANFNPAW